MRTLRTGRLFLAAVLSVRFVSAQPPAQSLTRPVFDSFEVAAVKPAGPNPQGRWIRMESANRFAAQNHALRTLIAAAYAISPAAVSGGPSWAESDGWDILAKTPGDIRPTLAEQMTMLRKLLAERFQLTFHREPKTMAVYTLTVAKDGPRLRPAADTFADSPAGAPPLIFRLGPGIAQLPGRAATIAELASVLQRAALDRPVLDQTGLVARYDFDLAFTPEPAQFGGAGLAATADSTQPDLYLALQQQLGLKLEAARGTVQAIVIDRAERPSAN